MSFDPFTRLTSRTLVLGQENIDTDQIIPARFLTTTAKEGLGASLFYDWRYDEAGNRKNSTSLNQIDPAAHKILVAGTNFGCGSSREHAPWALYDFGFRAIISTKIADIFTSNALKNGLLPIIVDGPSHEWLLSTPGVSVTIDLTEEIVQFGDEDPVSFETEPFARGCLLKGVDPLGHLLGHADAIARYEVERQ